ncbi:NAC domain-containing protein 2-like [Mercurialis annua]|uniref:NAC domain-containing protein 2-like n=1 Tax=Mercurialis annua TaxID=3986 RepID=UPI0021607D98|nr:NAC domain-containing protein 2-like [Mercurialis annua]
MSNNQNQRPNPPIQSNLPRLTAQEWKFFKIFPPGYRFCPTDGELIAEYLLKKVYNQPLPPCKIMNVDLYKFHPKVLAATYVHYGETDWYFFTPRDKLCPEGANINRLADGGFWKSASAEKPVEHKGVIIGSKRVLDFYIGKQPNCVKTHWKMHELVVKNSLRMPEINPDAEESNMRLDDIVLCRIYKTSRKLNDPGAEEIGDDHEIIGDDNDPGGLEPQIHAEFRPANNVLLPSGDNDYQQSPYQHQQNPYQYQQSAGCSQPLQQQPLQNDQPLQPPQNDQPFRQQPPQNIYWFFPGPPPDGFEDPVLKPEAP